MANRLNPRAAIAANGHGRPSEVQSPDLPSPVANRDQVSDLDQERVALPTAGADRREPEPAAVAAEVVNHRPEDPAAARADRMTERDRTAVDVDALLVGPDQHR